MRITRSKAIRLKCLDCMCGQSNEVKLCPASNCPLYTYRLGYEIDSEGNRITRHKGSKNAFQNGKNDLRYEPKDECDANEN